MSITTVYSFNKDDIKLKFKEPFISEGLNAKTLAVIPSGIYRGFRIGTNGSSLTVNIVGDDVYSDSIAVINTINNYSLTIRHSTTFALSLAGVAGDTVVLVIEGIFDTSLATTATIKAYSTSTYDALSDINKAQFVVLGTVVVPASGLISSGAISLDRRTSAWSRLAREAYFPSLLMRNSGFELGGSSTGLYGMPFWENEISGENANWSVTDSFAKTGSKSALLTVTDHTTDVSGSLYQYINVPVVLNQILTVQLYLKVDVASTSLDSTANIFVEWGDNTGAVLSQDTSDLPIKTGANTFTLLSKTFVVPTDATHIKRIGIQLVNATYATNSDKFEIDDFSAFLETIDAAHLDSDDSRVAQQIAAPLLINDPTGLFSAVDALLRFDSTTTTLVGERSDQDSAATQVNLDWKGGITLGANLLSNEADAQKARVTAVPSTTVNVDYTLMWESIPSGEKGMRWYVSPVGTYVLTQNAVWGTVSWSKDKSGETASKMEFSKDGLTLFEKKASGDTEPWDNTIGVGGWTYEHINFNGATLSSSITGSLTVGDDLIDTAANASLPRIRTTAAPAIVSERTLIWDAGDGQSTLERTSRMYSTPTGGMEFTSNCYWDAPNALWKSDNTSFAATKMLFDNGSFRLFYKAATGSSWANGDVNWDSVGATFDAATITANNIAGSINLGSELINTAAKLNDARIVVNGDASGDNRAQILSMPPGDVTQTGIHVYGLGLSGDFEIVTGAVWDDAQNKWVGDGTNTNTATKLTLTVFEFRLQHKSDNTSAWTDSAWDTDRSFTYDIDGRTITMPDGKIKFSNPTTSVSNPVFTAGQTNTLVAKNTIKAWGTLLTGAAATFLDGFNFSNTIDTQPTYIKVSFATPMADTLYNVQLTSSKIAAANTALVLNYDNKNVNYFHITGFTIDTAAAIINYNLIAAMEISITVLGVQN